MNLSLSNTLGNGGSLNADGLSLDLAFALDKTLTARRGPTPTFTRASTATFIGSNGLIQSAAINEPRFNHDPITGVCRGLLIEELRINTRTYSEDFSQATYGKTGVSIASVSDTSPSGGATIQKLVEDTSTGAHGISFSNASGIQTLSVFCKSAGRQWVRFTGNSVVTWFDLQNGVVGTVGAGHTALITNFGNGWYRCSISFTEAGVGGIQVRASTADNILTYTGDGSSGIFAWGAQLEAGSFPTSYIPTTTAALTRSADVCNITGAGFTGMYNATEGTLFATASTFSPNTNLRRIVFATDGTIANRAGLLFNTVGDPTTFVVSSGGSVSALITSSVVSITSPVKVAGAYKLNDFAISANGGAGNFDTLGAVGIGINRLGLGSQNDTEFLNGHIARIQYFRKRLPNAKLQTLTT